MKKSLFILLSFIFFGTSFAKEISLKEAQNVAKKAYFQRLNNYFAPTTMEEIKISEHFTIREENKNVYYIFNIENYGFIIISAEDAMIPVLGYSFDRPHIPVKSGQNFKSLMKSYAENIQFLRDHQFSADEWVSNKWEEINNLNINSFKSTKDIVVNTLVPCTWNQDYPYNYFCPVDSEGPGGRALAGCVATCMSQIMYYWRWPETGTGSHSYYSPYGQLTVDYTDSYYDYNGMEDNSDAHTNVPMTMLQYEVGVSVDMDYGADGSGANSYDVDNAFRDYFKYSNSCQAVNRTDYTYSNWTQMVYDDLDAGRPLYYSGFSSSGGHAFVLDGYTDDDEFHFNYGWSGYDNGWFPIYNPNGYSSGQVMVRNIYPKESYTYPMVWSGVRNVPFTRGIIEDGSSPLYDYESNLDRSWVIDPSLDNQDVENITITIMEMDIASGDLLNIYDGEDENAPLLGSFSGSTPPAPFTSTAKKVCIRFTSDATDNGAGFRIHYEAESVETCGSGEMFTEQQATIDDGSGIFDYVNGRNCSWFIEPPGASQISIELLNFKTQEIYDHLTIYDGITFTVLDDFSGDMTSLPETYVYETSKLLITFKTDGIVADEGWSLKYYSDLVNVSENMNPLQSISVFPNPSTDVLNISFLSSKKSDIKISLYQINGTAVYTEETPDFSGEYKQAIELKDLSKGIYFLEIISTEDSFTKKIIIQ